MRTVRLAIPVNNQLVMHEIYALGNRVKMHHIKEVEDPNLQHLGYEIDYFANEAELWVVVRSEYRHDDVFDFWKKGISKRIQDGYTMVRRMA
jgi:hypothetical protein